MAVAEQIEPTATEQANRLFLERVQEIPGTRLDVRAGKTPSERRFRVFVQSRESDAWRQVRELEGELLDRFPGARLDVWLSAERHA